MPARGSRRRRGGRDRFLAQLEAVTPWSALMASIEPFYPKGEGAGRPPIGLERILRMDMAQQCFALLDEGIEAALYDRQAMRRRRLIVRPFDQQPLLRPGGHARHCRRHGRNRTAAKRQDSIWFVPSRQRTVWHADPVRARASALTLKGCRFAVRRGCTAGRPRPRFCPIALQSCRATPTERCPCFGNPLSSTIQKPPTSKASA